MKIKTNSGDAELTAEMVCRGMVFQSDNWIQNHARDGVLTMLHDDPGNPGAWKATVDDSWCFPEHAQRFLGCDPAIATRADCERFGVHGDAAAHGFARLRGGGAVDFEPDGGIPMPVGARVHDDTGGQRIVLPQTSYAARFLAERERFIGLDARHASPEDVRRMCCLAPQNGDIGSAVRCTLAIGDHDTHEDLATGVKWGARPNPLEHLRERATAFVSQPAACPNCGGDDAACRGSLAGLKACAAKGAQIGRASAAIEWRNGSAPLGQSQAHVIRDGDVYRWQVNHLGLRIRDGVSSLAAEARYEAACLLRDVHDATAGIEWLAGLFGLLFRVHDATPAAKRAKQEAPLAALVAAVPEGLDPIGWRAAVLAVHECQSRYGSPIQGDHFAAWLMHSLREDMDDCDAGTPYAYGYHGYLRAIAPAAKVDRVRATWKTRGPVLPCDNGEDE